MQIGDVVYIDKDDEIGVINAVITSEWFSLEVAPDKNIYKGSRSIYANEITKIGELGTETICEDTYKRVGRFLKLPITFLKVPVILKYALDMRMKKDKKIYRKLEKIVGEVIMLQLITHRGLR
jgi:hypothetical protein